MANRVIRTYQVEATVRMPNGNQRELVRTISAPDAGTVWHSLVGTVADLGAVLVTQRISEFDRHTGTVLNVIEGTQERPLLPPPPAVKEPWYKALAFSVQPIKVTVSPCTYKEKDDAILT